MKEAGNFDLSVMLLISPFRAENWGYTSRATQQSLLTHTARERDRLHLEYFSNHVFPCVVVSEYLVNTIVQGKNKLTSQTHL